jgi:pimeloyl-ACP methyl ester carboxylesterase
MSATVIDNGLVHYEAFGRGSPPIIFLHGWLGSWRYWMQTMESLAVDHRVIAIDLWGFGDSEKNEVLFTIDKQATLVEKFITNLGISTPILVGHSLGAVVAIEYASRHTDNVNKIMAVSLPLSHNAVDSRLKTFTESSLISNLRNKMFGWKPIPDKEIEAEVERAADKAISNSLASLKNYNPITRLTALTCDILIVFGEKDDVIKLEPVEQINGRLDFIKHIILPATRHFPMVDDSPKFNRLLKDFAERDATLESLTLKEEWRRRNR